MTKTTKKTATHDAKTACWHAKDGLMAKDAARDAAADTIAKSILGRDLETRNSDGEDFTEHAVWNLKAALAAAYEAGKAAGSRS